MSELQGQEYRDFIQAKSTLEVFLRSDEFQNEHYRHISGLEDIGAKWFVILPHPGRDSSVETKIILWYIDNNIELTKDVQRYQLGMNNENMPVYFFRDPDHAMLFKLAFG